MNKKVVIALVAVAVVLVGAIIWVVCINKPAEVPAVNGEIENNEEVKNPDETVSVPIPNVITKAGFIKEIGKNKVIINSADDKKVTVYITEDTKIYGPDGAEKELEDLKAGNYITIDIDGDEYKAEDTKVDALVIYISGK